MVVCGPTASGKTGLGVALARRLGGEIISADSMQIYKHMDIATAKPLDAEKKGVPHHLMDLLDPSEDFSVARFCALSKPLITEIRDRGNPKRILRCIEVYRLTGMTQTQLNLSQTAAPSPYKAIKIGLTASDREFLYERINRRVDLMLSSGLLDEARAFYDSPYGTTANAAIGYKELLPYLRGDLSLDECVENLKRATRRYAKRQLTWFRRDPSIHWFEIDRMSFDEIFSSALTIIKQGL